MMRFFSLTTLALFALMPYPALSQSNMTSTGLGVGPHGYDSMIGTWSCTNSMPSAIAGPATTTLTLSRSAQGSLMVHSTGANYDAAGFVAYNAKTKTWWNPTALGDGGYENESTKQTGSKSTWTGVVFNAATHTTSQIRDKYDFGSTSFTDVTQVQGGGGWKTVANTTCTKS